MPFLIPVLESDVEDYLIEQARVHGCLLRKVKWIGRDKAPDRMLVKRGGRTIWIELKAPGKLKTFPKSAHERGQWREHQRLRSYGLEVRVIDSHKGVDMLFNEVLW